MDEVQEKRKKEYVEKIAELVRKCTDEETLYFVLQLLKNEK